MTSVKKVSRTPNEIHTTHTLIQDTMDDIPHTNTIDRVMRMFIQLGMFDTANVWAETHREIYQPQLAHPDMDADDEDEKEDEDEEEKKNENENDDDTQMDTEGRG